MVGKCRVFSFCKHIQPCGEKSRWRQSLGEGFHPRKLNISWIPELIVRIPKIHVIFQALIGFCGGPLITLSLPNILRMEMVGHDWSYIWACGFNLPMSWTWLNVKCARFFGKAASHCAGRNPQIIGKSCARPCKLWAILLMNQSLLCVCPFLAEF